MATVLSIGADAESEEAAARLPANIDAEASLIGAILIDNRIAEDVRQQLKPEHFHEGVHGRVYHQVLTLLDRDMTVTPITLKPYFENDAALRALGGVGYLTTLAGEAGSLLGARDFARQIYDLALLRELVTVGRTLVESALDTSETVDPAAQIEAAEQALFDVSRGEGATGRAIAFNDASKNALRQIGAAFESGGKVAGVTTGLDDLNAKLGGMHRSDLIILAGRPGMGKTSLATNIAFSAAARWQRDVRDGIDPAKSIGARTAFFSLEMSSDQLATRVLAERSLVSSERLRTGSINKAEWSRLAEAAQELQELPLYIDDTPALTIGALRSRARRLKQRQDVGFIVVDYLQLLQGSGRASDNRVNEISEISRGLKTLAKEMDVPVLALSQLSRAVEQREDKRPHLSDLRESGSIEQDADVVLFIYRDEYYSEMLRPDAPHEGSTEEQKAKYAAWESEHQAKVGRATVIVGKHRHGSTGTVQLAFNSEYTLFENLARGDYPDG